MRLREGSKRAICPTRVSRYQVMPGGWVSELEGIHMNGFEAVSLPTRDDQSMHWVLDPSRWKSNLGVSGEALIQEHSVYIVKLYRLVKYMGVDLYFWDLTS